jgi:hypothetical protein
LLAEALIFREKGEKKNRSENQTKRPISQSQQRYSQTREKQMSRKAKTTTNRNLEDGFLIMLSTVEINAKNRLDQFRKSRLVGKLSAERGDVPGWVLVVLMTTGLVTAIWTIAAPRLTAILKNSLDSMNGIR